MVYQLYTHRNKHTHTHTHSEKLKREPAGHSQPQLANSHTYISDGTYVSKLVLCRHSQWCLVTVIFLSLWLADQEYPTC